MSGYELYKKYQRIEKLCAEFGFKFSPDRYNNGRDQIHLVALDDALPTYNREVTLFRGNLEEIDCFLAGIRFAREYDQLLGYKNHKTRPAREQKYIEREAAAKLRREQNDTMRRLASPDGVIRDPLPDVPF